MGKAGKVKAKIGAAKLCTNCFNPKYLKFNFTYFDAPKELTGEYRAQLLNRIICLSAEPFVTIMGWPKATGFEFEALDIHKTLPEDFKHRFSSSQYEKLAVMRLYSNNNPVVGRIVGVIIRNVFYVMFAFMGDNTGYKR